MPTKVYETRIKATTRKVWDFLASPFSLRLLTPPDQEMEIISKDNFIREGCVQEFKTKQIGLWVQWKVRITKVNEPHNFTFTGIKTPFKEWIHHVDIIDEEGITLFRETVHYEVKGGPLGNIINSVSSDEKLDKYFKFRQKTIRSHLETDKAEVNSELFDKAGAYVSDFDLDQPLAVTDNPANTESPSAP